MRERIDDAFGDAVREVFRVRIITHVDEGQDRERIVGRAALCSARARVRQSWNAPGDDLRVQFDGGPLRLGVQFFVQRRAAFSVLAERLWSAPGRRVEMHQLTLGCFVRRVKRHKRFEAFNALPIMALCLIESGDAQQEFLARAPQLLPPRRGPIGIQVFRQQVAAVQR